MFWYILGGSLHDWEMPEDRIVDMLWQINQGVAHMHRRRIIHRDLKGVFCYHNEVIKEQRVCT